MLTIRERTRRNPKWRGNADWQRPTFTEYQVLDGRRIIGRYATKESAQAAIDKSNPATIR